MKTILPTIALISRCKSQLWSVSPTGTRSPLVNGPSAVQAIPPYLPYRHFLGWVNELDKAAVAAKATDPYQFAQPFGRANLQCAHLDILWNEAHHMAGDLQQQDASASEYIVRAAYQVETNGACPLSPSATITK